MDIQPTEKKSNLVKNIFLIVGVIVALAVITLEVRAVTLPENRTLRRVNLGNRYLSELKYEEAIAEYDLAIAIDPKNVDAYLGKAEAYVQMDDIDSAIETLAEGYDETEDDEIREEWLDLQMDLARKCLEEEDYEQAVIEFDNVLDIDDGYVEAYLWKAEAQENLGDTDAAMETLQEGYDRTGDARLQRAMEELDPIIAWHDDVIEQWTRDALGIPEGDIRQSDVLGITEMGLSGRGVASVEDLAHFTSLEHLDLSYNNISDISALGSLTNLNFLELESNNISDISPLGSLTSLTWLCIMDNQVTDISALSNLTNLEELWLSGNQISDISPVSFVNQIYF